VGWGSLERRGGLGARDAWEQLCELIAVVLCSGWGRFEVYPAPFGIRELFWGMMYVCIRISNMLRKAVQVFSSVDMCDVFVVVAAVVVAFIYFGLLHVEPR
jgi:hypothetical protein